MSARGAGVKTQGVITTDSLVIKPPAHPTYDLKAVIKLALAEDAGNIGLLSLHVSYFQLFCYVFRVRSLFFLVDMGCTNWKYSFFCK